MDTSSINSYGNTSYKQIVQSLNKSRECSALHSSLESIMMKDCTCWKCNELKNWLQLYGRVKLLPDINEHILVCEDKDTEEQYEWRE